MIHFLLFSFASKLRDVQHTQISGPCTLSSVLFAITSASISLAATLFDVRVVYPLAHPKLKTALLRGDSCSATLLEIVGNLSSPRSVELTIVMGIC